LGILKKVSKEEKVMKTRSAGVLILLLVVILAACQSSATTTQPQIQATETVVQPTVVPPTLAPTQLPATATGTPSNRVNIFCGLFKQTPQTV